MMDVSYRREMNHNYMIIVSPGEVSDGYECRMLAGNCIEGLLKFRIRHQEEQKNFYYEITSKQPLQRLFEQRSITGEEIRRLLLSLAATLNKVEEYLLREEQILLDPEYIYIEPDQFSVYLCMVPGYTGDFPAAFTALLQYLLEKVDHQDKDGVILAYHLYHESLKENYGMADLLRYLSKQDGPIFDGKKEAAVTVATGRDSAMETRGDAEQDGDELKGEYGGERGAKYRGGQGYPGDWEGQGGRERRGGHAPETEEKTGSGRLGCVKKRQEPKKKRETKRYAAAASCFLKISILSAGGIAALWFLAGREAAVRYGGILGPAAAGIYLIRWIFIKRPAGDTNADEDKKREPVLREDMESKKGEPGSRALRDEFYNQEIEEARGAAARESWRIHFEDNYKRDQDAVCAETEEAESVGTALLADFSAQKGAALLESLSRERESIEISYVPFLIGKHADMTDYCLKQPTVSRLHLRVDKKEGVYIATDLNSTNGTTVEGYHLQANETVSIKNGDVIYLADIGYRFIERNR